MRDHHDDQPRSVASSPAEQEDPTVVLRKHARSRPLAMSGELDIILTVLKGQRQGEVIVLRHGDTLVGRGQGVDLHLCDRGVSRNHVRISVSDRGRVELLDLESTNGTFVNGERAARERLRYGDRIRVGLEAVLELGFVQRLATESPPCPRPEASIPRLPPPPPTTSEAPPAPGPRWGYSEATIIAYGRLLELRRERLGARHPAVAEMLETMGVALQDNGHLEAALEHLRQALDIFQEQASATPRATARALARVASVELALGQPRAAVRRLEQAEQLLSASDGSDAVELARVRLSLAHALWTEGSDLARTSALARKAHDALVAAEVGASARLDDPPAWTSAPGSHLVLVHVS